MTAALWLWVTAHQRRLLRTSQLWGQGIKTHWRKAVAIANMSGPMKHALSHWFLAVHFQQTCSPRQSDSFHIHTHSHVRARDGAKAMLKSCPSRGRAKLEQRPAINSFIHLTIAAEIKWRKFSFPPSLSGSSLVLHDVSVVVSTLQLSSLSLSDKACQPRVDLCHFSQWADYEIFAVISTQTNQDHEDLNGMVGIVDTSSRA